MVFSSFLTRLLGIPHVLARCTGLRSSQLRMTTARFCPSTVVDATRSPHRTTRRSTFTSLSSEFVVKLGLLVSMFACMLVCSLLCKTSPLWDFNTHFVLFTLCIRFDALGVGAVVLYDVSVHHSSCALCTIRYVGCKQKQVHHKHNSILLFTFAIALLVLSIRVSSLDCDHDHLLLSCTTTTTTLCALYTHSRSSMHGLILQRRLPSLPPPHALYTHSR